MLKKPYTSEDDLDLIIANLFRGEKAMQAERENDAEKRSSSLIDKSIEFRALPIQCEKDFFTALLQKHYKFYNTGSESFRYYILQNKKNIV